MMDETTEQSEMIALIPTLVYGDQDRTCSQCESPRSANMVVIHSFPNLFLTFNAMSMNMHSVVINLHHEFEVIANFHDWRLLAP